MGLDRVPARTWPQTAWQQRSPHSSWLASLSAQIHGQGGNDVFRMCINWHYVVKMISLRQSCSITVRNKCSKNKGITKQKGSLKCSIQTKCFLFLSDSFVASQCGGRLHLHAWCVTKEHFSDICIPSALILEPLPNYCIIFLECM